MGVRSSWLMRDRNSLRALCSRSDSLLRTSSSSIWRRSVTSWTVPTILTALPSTASSDLTVRLDRCGSRRQARTMRCLVPERLASRDRLALDRPAPPSPCSSGCTQVEERSRLGICSPRCQPKIRYSSSEQVASSGSRLHSQLPSCASFCASASCRRLLPDRLLRALALGDVLYLGDRVGRVPGAVAHERHVHLHPDRMAVGVQVALGDLIAGQLAGQHPPLRASTLTSRSSGWVMSLKRLPSELLLRYPVSSHIARFTWRKRPARSGSMVASTMPIGSIVEGALETRLALARLPISGLRLGADVLVQAPRDHARGARRHHEGAVDQRPLPRMADASWWL